MDDSIKIPMRILTTSLANEVSELLLLKSDLEYCIEGFKLFATIGTPEDETDWQQRHAASSIFRDSVVTFMACFDTSVAKNLEVEAVYKAYEDKGALSYFQWLKALRDAWIAHRHGPSRTAFFGFLIDPDSGHVIGHGPFVSQFQFPIQSVGRDCANFATIALQHVDVVLADAKNRLLEEINTLYPNERLKLPIGTMTAPAPTELRMGRRKYQNITAQRKRAPKPPTTDEQSSS